MASSLPYLPSNKNLEMLFSKIQSAKVPDKFTHSFLQTTIGLKGTNDRPLIPFLRALGFINQSGTTNTNLSPSEEQGHGESRHRTGHTSGLCTAFRSR
jgi:hypothetical protein